MSNFIHILILVTITVFMACFSSLMRLLLFALIVTIALGTMDIVKETNYYNFANVVLGSVLLWCIHIVVKFFISNKKD